MIFDYLHDSLTGDGEGPKSLYSIAVTVYEANQVAWENLETRVYVQLGKVKQFTKVRESSERPYFNEYFTFDYEGSLEKMMDTILVIAVQNYRPGLRSHRLLGSARLDLGAIWTQPGHGIADKWILLTHPSDPSGHIRGYINCEIAILPSGEKPHIRRFKEPRDYFIPETQGGGKLKARYIFRIHKGVNMYQNEKKAKMFIRVYFAGLSGETTKRKPNAFPYWKEEIVFTELFPPMYNRLRIDVHFGKNHVCTKFLDLSTISDPAIKGYLPTYGPSFLHLYKPPYQYLGSLLVSLETLTVRAFSESEKLLGVKRQRTQELVEKLFWKNEDFALFGVVYEVSMLTKTNRQGPSDELHLCIGFASSDNQPFSDENKSMSLSNTMEPMGGLYWCWPKKEAKQTVFTKQTMPDYRHRLFMSNRLLHIAKEFSEDLSQIQFQVEHSPETARVSVEAALARFIANCNLYKLAKPPESTMLDQERFKSQVTKMNKLIKEINMIKEIKILTEAFEKCIEIYKEIANLVNDPQESFPMIILTLRKGPKVISYARVHPRNIIFSLKDYEKGLYCGKIQTIFLKMALKDSDQVFAGKLDILLWLGPFQSLGYGLLSIPTGYEDISYMTTFPREIFYVEVHNFICRVHLYQGHFLPCDDVTGSCSIQVTIHYDCKSASSSVKEVLSPVWMETVIIKDIRIFGNAKAAWQNPPQIVMEVWNTENRYKNLLGRQTITPQVFRSVNYSKAPTPRWYKIHQRNHIRGEILAMFEIIEDRKPADPGGRDSQTEVINIPEEVKYRTKSYRLEILLWGIRGSFSLPISTLNNPKVRINCGTVHITSFHIKNPSSFPNFNQPLFIFDLDLPVEWLYAPPFVVRLFDSRSFGTKIFIGSHVVRNINKFIKILPNTDNADHAVFPQTYRPSSDYLSRKDTMMELNKLYKLIKPIVDLKNDVPERTQKITTLMNSRVSKFWKKLCFCFYLRREEENPGYISLGLVSPMNDPDSDEQFFDWWTKYFESLPWKHLNEKDVQITIDIDKKVSKVKEKNHTWKTPRLQFYTTELENQPEFEGFEDILSTFRLTKPSLRRLNDTGIFKGAVALYEQSPGNITTQGTGPYEGLFAGVEKELGAVVPIVVRVYVVRAHQLTRTERLNKVNSFIEVCVSHNNSRLSDSDNCIRNECSPIFGRCYELNATLPFDSTLTVRVMNKISLKSSELIGETIIDIENRYYSRHRGSCGLQRVYSTEGYNVWRDIEKPSSILTWMCLSHNVPLPEYHVSYIKIVGQAFTINNAEFINPEPEVIRENLALTVLLNWHQLPVSGCKLVSEHVETRSLYSPHQPGIEKGKLEMWVDILHQDDDIPPAVNIKPRIPEKYELRVVVWSTMNVKLVNIGQMVGKKNTDIFVKGWLKGKEDLQKTDVHYASLTGEGSFNWRFIYEFAYDHQEKMMILDDLTNKRPPIMYIQIWDMERLMPSQHIGSLSLDLRDLPSPSKRFWHTRKYLPMKGWKRNLFKDRYVRGSWPVTTLKSDGKPVQMVMGMVDLELTLLTSLEAERSPAGRGRNDPDALPPPTRPIVKYTVWIVPFRAIKNYLWTYHKGAILKLLFGFIFSIFCLVMVYAFPNYTIKRILGA